MPDDVAKLQSVGAWQFFQHSLDACEVREKVRSYQERYDIPTEELR